ncbi:M48 family metalloprotease [Streptantibioticus ferralitis]|uniref:M48 family metalloprotease n=1 Tax=Streptantibioticus ferralitis TaxID=236510 RepID=A0ABT5Z7F5_9ACTN|nr:M48 family metalloprotease [Streptantibioticus ferralitis]MDF2259761.1 M48 family metalloprotease [Streptantibioticus ferralitis]
MVRNMLKRFGMPGVVLLVTAAVVTVRQFREVSLAEVLVAAVIAAALRAGLGFGVLSEATFRGIVRQDMTWEVYRQQAWEPSQADMAAEAEQMRRVDARVTAFADEYGMERISLAVAGAHLGWWGAAESIRPDRAHAHIELGHFWFFPEGLTSLPHIVEHELAHIQRRDTRTHEVTAACAVALTVLWAGLLPYAYAAVAIAATALAVTACSWWAELACDTIAARQCGRPAALAALSYMLGEAQALPGWARLLHTATMLRSHPPTRLRLWWVRRIPSVPASLGEAPTAGWGIGC